MNQQEQRAPGGRTWVQLWLAACGNHAVTRDPGIIEQDYVVPTPAHEKQARRHHAIESEDAVKFVPCDCAGTGGCDS